MRVNEGMRDEREGKEGAQGEGGEGSVNGVSERGEGRGVEVR